MTLRSQIYPTTNKLPENGGVIKIESDLIKTDTDDHFLGGADATWDVLSGDVTLIEVAGEPLKVTLLADGYHYLTKLYADNANFSFEAGFKYEPNGAEVDEVMYEFWVYDASGVPDNDFVVRFNYTAAGGTDIELSWSDSAGGFDSISQWTVPEEATFRLTHTNGKTYVYLLSSDGWTLLYTHTQAFVAQVYVDVGMYNLNASVCGTMTLRPFRNVPVLNGIYCKSDSRIPTLLSSSNGEAYFEVLPGAPGSYNVTTYGSGSSIGVADSPDALEVIEAINSENSMNLMLSNVKKLYTDDPGIYTCDRFAFADEANISDTIITANCCFCDGSPLDNDPAKIITNTFGKFTQYGNRKRSPEFLLETDGKNFGCNFEYQRIHHGDQSLSLSEVDEVLRWIVLRTLELSDGKRLYYGLIGEKTTSKNILPHITYTASTGQGQDGTNDKIWWELYREDSLTPVEDLTPAPYVGTKIVAGVLDVPAVISLSPGRYYFKCRIESEYATGPFSAVNASQGGRCEIVIHKGSTTADTVIAEGYTEAIHHSDNPYASVNAGECNTFFEVTEERYSIGAILYDPCNETISFSRNGVDLASSRTESIAAFENDEGNAVIMYQHAPTIDLYADRSKDVSYTVFNTSSKTFTSIKSIFLPMDLNSYIYSFDAQRVDNRLEIFLSEETDDKYVMKDPLDDEVLAAGLASGLFVSSRPFSPMGAEGIKKYTFDITSIPFDGASSLFNEPTNISTIMMTSIEEFYRVKGPDTYFGDKVADQFKHAFARRIRVNRNKDFGLTVLTVIDQTTTMPLILMGDENFSEVCVPMHFDMKGDIRNLMKVFEKPTQSDTKVRPNAIDSCSAFLHHDGMIYSFASKDSLMEVGVCDPALFWDNSVENFYESILVQAINLDETKIYTPEYRFESREFLNLGDGSVDTDYAINVDVSLSSHYGVVTVASNEWGKAPIIYQNGFYDEAPFETTSGRVWIPELGGDLATVEFEDVTFLDTYASIKVIDSAVVSNMKIDDYTYKNNNILLGGGIKFKARLKTVPQAGRTDLDKPFSIQIAASTIIDLSDLDALTDEYITIYAEIRLLGDSAAFYIYNVDGGTWDLVYTVIGLSVDKVYDYFIIVKRVGDDKADIAFVIKSNDHTDGVINNSVHSHDFENELVAYHFEGTVRTLATTTPDNYIAVFQPDIDAAPIDEYIRIYELGYNGFNNVGPTSVYEGTMDAVPYDIYQRDLFNSSRGSWREFDDSLLFEYKNSPSYPFRAGTYDSAETSNSFHFYNGFTFNLSGSIVYGEDNWTLQRSLLNDIEYVRSEKLHGLWRSSDDSSDIYVWADANDSGLDKFFADYFVVTGTNVTNIEVVGKDLIGDGWTTLGNINLERYAFDGITKVESLTNLLVKTDAEMSSGKFGEYPHYYYEDGIAQPYSGKVVDVNGGEIICKIEDGVPLDATAGVISSSRGSLKLETEQEFRYIGFKLPALKTYEGYFLLENIDFGLVSNIPLADNYALGGGLTYNMKSIINYVVNQQAYTQNEKLVSKQFSFTYKLLDATSFMKFTSLLDENDLNGKPIWVCQDTDNRPHDVYLTLMDKDVTHKVVLDEDGVEVYEMSLSFKGVGE